MSICYIVLLLTLFCVAQGADLSAVEAPLNVHYRVGSARNPAELIVPEGKYPYIVQVLIDVNSCTGSIISQNWVLTAGHCVDVSQSFYGVVRYGSNDISKMYYANIVKIARHPGYFLSQDHQVLRNDIALLKVNTNFNILPVTLPQYGSQLRQGDEVAIVGFGETRYMDKIVSGPTRMLQEVKVYVTAYEGKQILILSNTESAEAGDSGGPLLKDNIQHGVASFVAQPAYGPKVYQSAFESVSMYRNWIDCEMREHGICYNY